MAKKKNLTKIIAMLLVIMTCASFMILPASAATSGGTGSSTITVQTSHNWSRPGTESITLKQNKCTYYYKALKGTKWVTKTGSMYPHYTITIKNNTNGQTTKKTWRNSSIKLSLNRDSRYTITVSYDWQSTWLSSNCRAGDWKNSPSWWVSATCKSSAW